MYLVSPLSVSFMARRYSLDPMDRYCAREGFFRTAREVIDNIPFEIQGGQLIAETGPHREAKGDYNFEPTAFAGGFDVPGPAVSITKSNRAASHEPKLLSV
jgi:hypothetical protein